MSIRDFNVTRNRYQKRHQGASLPSTFIERQICCDEKCHNKQMNPEGTNFAMPLQLSLGALALPLLPGKEDGVKEAEHFDRVALPRPVASTGTSDAANASQCAQQGEMHARRQPQFTDETFAPSAARVLADPHNVKRDISLVLSTPSLAETPDFWNSHFDMLWVVTMPPWQSGRSAR